jgi:hypothetical protein
MTGTTRAVRLTSGWYYLLPEVAAPLGGGLLKVGRASTWAAVTIGLAPYVILASLYALFIIGYVPAVICYLSASQDRQDAADRLITTSADAIVSLLTLTHPAAAAVRSPARHQGRTPAGALPAKTVTSRIPGPRPGPGSRAAGPGACRCPRTRPALPARRAVPPAG